MAPPWPTPRTGIHFQKDGGVWPDHCVMHTWGAELHPRLVVAGPVVRKGSNGEDGYSGFTVRDPVTGDEHATELASALEERGIDSVVVVGLALDYCVRDTALDAVRLGLSTTVMADATAAVNLQPGDGARAVASLVNAGVAIV